MLDDDGWLRSGDIAEIDADGFVTITDRKKDILVTAGGKNVAPQNLENELKASRYVSQALVVGDRRPVRRRADHARPGRDRQRARARVAATATLAPTSVVRSCRASSTTSTRERSRFEQIKRFAILPRDFTIEDGEVTPTLKLKRRVVLEHFADEIDACTSASG